MTSVSYFDYKSFQKQQWTGGRMAVRLNGSGVVEVMGGWQAEEDGQEKEDSREDEDATSHTRRRTSGAVGRALHEMDGSLFGGQIILFVIS
jgi:hypothetical protein